MQTSAVASLFEGQADVGALNDKAAIEKSWAKSSQRGLRPVEDERVITTFRWPAALDGQEVSVSGKFNLAFRKGTGAPTSAAQTASTMPVCANQVL